MDAHREALPDDIETLKSALTLALERADQVAAELAVEQARRSDDHALIALLKLQIEKLQRDRFGPRSERTARLLDQLELQLEELEAAASAAELSAQAAAAKTTTVAAFER
jgi:hypothetical protein